jgi:hypothetical protein
MPAGKTKFLDKFRMTPETKDGFYDFLDTIPEKDRVVYAFHGSKSSVWQKMGGGTSHMIGLFLADRLVMSNRGMVKVSTEKGHQVYPLSEIADIKVRPGPIYSSVEIQFRNGSKVKIVHVDHAVAQPLTQFMTDGLAAFDRSRLDMKTFNAMFLSYVLAGLPLPDSLKRGGKAVA